MAKSFLTYWFVSNYLLIKNVKKIFESFGLESKNLITFEIVLI